MLVAAEGIFWMGLVGLALALTALAGCGEDSPLAPEGGEISMVGGLKSDSASSVKGGAGSVHIVRMSGAPAAPSIVSQEDGDELEIKVKVSLEDDGLMITIAAEEGALVSKDVIKLYYEGNDDDYLGKVRIPTGAYLEEIVLLVEIDDLPDDEDEIDIIVIIERDDKEVAKDSADADLSDLNEDDDLILLEEVSVSDKNEITLTFSDRVDARISVKYNVSVVVDGKDLRIRSYREDGDKVALIMREDLVAGDYEVEYNDEGGLRGLDGKKVQKFSETFVIEAEVTDADPWLSVKVGILSSNGNTVARTLTALGVNMTTWAERIVKDGVRIERRKEWIDLYTLTEEDLGLTGRYTIEDVYDAGKDLGYAAVPEEAAVTASLLGMHKDGEHFLIMSDFLRYSGKDYLLVITRKPVGHPTGDWLAAHRFSNGMRSGVVAGHTFVFTR